MIEFNRGKMHTDNILAGLDLAERGMKKMLSGLEIVDRGIEEADADPEVGNDVEGYSNASGTSLVEIKADQKKLQELSAEVVKRFPSLAPTEPAPEPEEEPTSGEIG